MRRTAAIALVVAAACAAPARGVVGTSCELNSECDTPLVCRLGHCRNECATSADCAAGLACVLDALGLGACQLPAETRCALQSECPEELVCRFMQCANDCEADRDCPGGARCERGPEGPACIERSGAPCVLDDECDPRRTGQRCVMGRCRRECFTDRDCRNDFRCQAGVCAPPPAITYDCGAFSEDPGWIVRAGFRAVVVADASDGLAMPAALTFAGDGYGGALYVVSSGPAVGMMGTIHRVDVATGATTLFSEGASWAPVPTALTSIVWDAEGARDGALYVGDQGTGFDGDGAIYRLAEDGTATQVIRGPGSGLDDPFALAFAPAGSGYATGLYVAGDTDNTMLPDWGVVSGATVTTFSEVAGIEGASFDVTGAYGGSLWAARPLGSGYAGDATITPIDPTGMPGTPILSGERGIHGVTFSERGAFGARMYAASWSSQTVIEIMPDGTRSELARGLMLSNFGGNVLAVSSDGEVIFVAEQITNRVVCIEPL